MAPLLKNLYFSKALFDAPSHLTDEEAAALPVAGVTAYRALFPGQNFRKVKMY